MTWEHAAMAAILGVPIACWLGYMIVIWRQSRPPKPPEPTPWADSTKVAQELRAQRRGRRTALLRATIADEDRSDSD